MLERGPTSQSTVLRSRSNGASSRSVWMASAWAVASGRARAGSLPEKQTGRMWLMQLSSM